MSLLNQETVVGARICSPSTDRCSSRISQPLWRLALCLLAHTVHSLSKYEKRTQLVHVHVSPLNSPLRLNTTQLWQLLQPSHYRSQNQHLLVEKVTYLHCVHETLGGVVRSLHSNNDVKVYHQIIRSNGLRPFCNMSAPAVGIANDCFRCKFHHLKGLLIRALGKG